MSAITRSTGSRANKARPFCGVSAAMVRISCKPNKSCKACATAGLSSMMSTLRMAQVGSGFTRLASRARERSIRRAAPGKAPQADPAARSRALRQLHDCCASGPSRNGIDHPKVQEDRERDTHECTDRTDQKGSLGLEVSHDGALGWRRARAANADLAATLRHPVAREGRRCQAPSPRACATQIELSSTTRPRLPRYAASRSCRMDLVRKIRSPSSSSSFASADFITASSSPGVARTK